MRWGFRVRGRRGAHPAPHSTARPRVALAVRAARLTGRRPEDVLTEALADWLAGYSATAAAAPSPLHIPGRQHSWGEIEETLRALRAS